MRFPELTASTPTAPAHWRCTPELPFPITYVIVIVNNAREIKGIITTPMSTTSITLTRK